MKTLTQTAGYSITKDISLVFGFAILMAFSAYIRIPLFFTPVPITTQTLVLYVSFVYLKRNAAFSQIIYLALGACGLPVFTNGASGLGYFAGPTGGYLLGFIVSAFVIPKILPQDKSFAKSLAAFSLAVAIVFGCGAAWLMAGFKFTFAKAIGLGVLPFIIGDAVKALVATTLYTKK